MSVALPCKRCHFLCTALKPGAPAGASVAFNCTSDNNPCSLRPDSFATGKTPQMTQKTLDWLAAHEADMHALLEALVNTDSNSHDREGVNREPSAGRDH